MCEQDHSENNLSKKLLNIVKCKPNVECVKMLLNQGADANTCDPRGKTSLMYAAWIDNAECIDVLLKAGADVNMSDARGITALMEALSAGNSVCVEKLLKAGADVNIKNSLSGDTALMSAVQMPSNMQGREMCVKLLIKSGTDVNVRAKDGSTALIEAGKHASTLCIQLLIDAGADVNARSVLGKTALLNVAKRGCTEGMKILIEAGADVNEIDYYRRTPLILVSSIDNFPDLNLRVSERDRAYCIRLLIKYGACVNKFDTMLGNALNTYLTSCFSIDKEVVMLLFAAGEIIDRTGKEPLLHRRRPYTSRRIPDYLLETNFSECSLMNLCRETIRLHLLCLNPHGNLFLRIPQLQLPSMMTNFCCTICHSKTENDNYASFER